MAYQSSDGAFLDGGVALSRSSHAAVRQMAAHPSPPTRAGLGRAREAAGPETQQGGPRQAARLVSDPYEVHRGMTLLSLFHNFMSGRS